MQDLTPFFPNAEGQRVKKTVNEQTTIFHFDQNGLMISESTSAGTITAEYAYLNGQPLAKIENNNVYYYHNDHLGTPALMTDSSSNTVWQGEFKPFGEPVSIAGSITNNLRFPGQYYDNETGLHQNWHRDYKAEIGRYVEADPLGLKADLNPYLYAKANPIRYADPFGLLSCDEVKKLAATNNLSGQSDEMIVCVCWKESSFNPNAQSSTSTARGLMQVTKAAAKDAGYDYDLLYDSATNIKAGSTYLKLRIKWAGGNVTKGLEGYGTGPGYATNILSCEKCLKDNPCDCEKCLKLIH